MRLVRLLALVLMLLGGLSPALAQKDAPQLVPDVSQRTVEIQFSFTGAELLLFGAILYPGGRVPEDPVDIIVVLKGPSQAVTIREKQKLAGIWVNADSLDFRSAPSFYAVASSRPIDEIVDERTAAIYEFGLGKLQLSPAAFSSVEEIGRFAAGLNDLRARSGLYLEAPDAVEITDGVLYRARLPLSARVVTGTYTAETFLVQDGRVLAAAVREIEVHKTGFERAIGVFAQDHGVAYGLIAVFTALALGLFAGVVGGRMKLP